jgi:hypothetical protein
MGKETPYFGDLDISTKNPDNSSIIGGIIITLFFSFICVSIGMIGFLTYIFDDITMIPLIIGLLFFTIPFFLIYRLINKFSTHRLILKHDKDVLVLEKAFQGKRWNVKRKTLSESVYLSYHYYTIVSHESDVTYSDGSIGSGSSSKTIKKYHIHGFSKTEGEWDLEISRFIGDLDHDKAREIAKYIGIEFRDEGEVQPKGLVIG